MRKAPKQGLARLAPTLLPAMETEPIVAIMVEVGMQLGRRGSGTPSANGNRERKLKREYVWSEIAPCLHAARLGKFPGRSTASTLFLPTGVWSTVS